ncbi:MAG TPA: universal stress protein [Steroidobacteraceae bacterium]|nr:universal stress protein [Steroidobacteraceae bacterium]
MSAKRVMWAVATPADLVGGIADKVAQLCAAMGAELEVFSCVYDADIARPGGFASRGAQLDIQEVVERFHDQLEHNAELLRRRGLRVRTSVRWDSPVHEGIVRQVLRHEPDLLIVRSRRKGRVLRAMLTQTDFKLIETCPCALLLIKSSRPYAGSRVIAALDPTHAHAKPASLDDAIIQAARSAADALSAELVLVHARTSWEQIIRDQPDLQNISRTEQTEVRSAYWRNVESRVREVARRHKVGRARVRIEDGKAAERLPALIRTERAGIVTMGAVSRSLVKRLFIGHTAERLLDALRCDVLIAKPPGFQTPVVRASAHRTDRSAARSGRYVF